MTWISYKVNESQNPKFSYNKTAIIIRLILILMHNTKELPCRLLHFYISCSCGLHILAPLLTKSLRHSHQVMYVFLQRPNDLVPNFVLQLLSVIPRELGSRTVYDASYKSQNSMDNSTNTYTW